MHSGHTKQQGAGILTLISKELCAPADVRVRAFHESELGCKVYEQFLPSDSIRRLFGLSHDSPCLIDVPASAGNTLPPAKVMAMQSYMPVVPPAFVIALKYTVIMLSQFPIERCGDFLASKQMRQ